MSSDQNHDGLIVPRRSKSMPGRCCYGGTMGALDPRDFTEQGPVLFVDDHHAVLPGNEQPVIGWIGNS